MAFQSARDPMVHGLTMHKTSLQQFHPLEESEKTFDANTQAAMMDSAKKIQGMHVPLKIQMEMNATKKVGHFPCISQRSNLAHDILTGRDELIEPRDIYGKPQDFTGMSVPRYAMEKQFGF